MFVEFIKDGKVITSESINNETALANCEAVMLEDGGFEIEHRIYDVANNTYKVILGKQCFWVGVPDDYGRAMQAYKDRRYNTIDLDVPSFNKMKEYVADGSKLLAVKHVKDAADCGLKEAKDFVDTYYDCVL